MSNPPYRPGRPLPVHLERAGARTTLVLERDFSHPPALLWAALTDPAQLATWAPFDAERNLGGVGPVSLTQPGTGAARAPVTHDQVRQAERPRVLEHSWDDDLLRWELEPRGSGTRMTLRHSTLHAEHAAKLAAGWQICTDVLDLALSGEPIGRLVGDAARAHGWQRLHDAYASSLGIE